VTACFIEGYFKPVRKSAYRDSGISIRKIKPLKAFDGSLQEFIAATLKAKKPDNTVKKIGTLSAAVVKDLSKRKIKPATEAIYINDKKILRAGRDAKATKGKSVAPERLHEIEGVLKTPLAIVRDKRTDDVIYIYAGNYDNNRLIKIVVDVDYNVGGNSVSLAKSVGLVDKGSLADSRFYEILYGTLQ